METNQELGNQEPPKQLFNFHVMNNASESKKCSSFVSEPMGNKLVSEISGIGEVTAKKLYDADIIYAYQLVGLYMFHGKNDDRFIKLLIKEFGMNNNHALAAKNCIITWVDSYC